MPVVRRLAALLLMFCLLPGAGEVVENAAHLFQHGHLAHVESADHDHGPGDPEHGCTTTFHLCSCHHGPSFLAPATLVLLGPDQARVALEAAASAHTNGTRTEIFRPPRFA